jgi:hypothetical protein
MADRYLVATGNWNSTDTWSDETGGDPGASFPTASDNVFLDANSGAVTLTVNVSSACLNFDCTGFTGTLAGSVQLAVWGTVFKLAAGMTHTTALNVAFRRTSGTTAITCSGKSLNGQVDFNGSGGTFQLQDKLTRAGNYQFNLFAGTFDANGQDVSLTGGIPTINGAFSFYNLECKPVSVAAGFRIVVSSNFTVTNNLVLNSNSTDADKRLLITSNTRGTARTITCNGTVTANYCDFEDITGAGDADWDLSAATGGSGDCGGNTDITFTTAATVYQVGSGNNNFSADVWKTASGGATAARRPLPQDTAVLDANSTTGTMTQNLQRIGTISAAAFTGTLTTSTDCTCYGSITLGSGLTLTASTQAYTLAGRGTHTLTSAGKTWAKNFMIDAPGGSYTLQDALVMGGVLNTLTLISGTFDANDFDVTCGVFSSTNSNVRTLSMGSGTWNLRAVSNICWTTATITNLTLNEETSLIKIAPLSAVTTPYVVFVSGTETFYNLEIDTDNTNFSTLVNAGGCVFNNIRINPGCKVLFAASTTTTATTWEIEGTSGSPIELASTTTTAAVVAKAGGGTVTADYATITYLTGTPADTFYATNSTDGGNNTGWTFSALPSAGLKILGVQSPAKVNGVALPMKINGVTA